MKEYRRVSWGKKKKSFKINTVPTSGSGDKQGFIGTLKGREARKRMI